jgi:malate synthase
MRAYTRRLVETCHRRGAHAIGGMAAFIPSRRDPEVNRVALEQVRADKEREAGDGFDGTWVAHPDLVPVAAAAFDAVLGARPHQKDRLPKDPRPTDRDLLTFTVDGGRITREGLYHNIRVALGYLAAWLEGRGAVALFNLMEDAATAEIARAQVWQWVRHGAAVDDGTVVTADWVRELTETAVGEWIAEGIDAGSLTRARDLFLEVALDPHFIEFLTLPAYAFLP